MKTTAYKKCRLLLAATALMFLAACVKDDAISPIDPGVSGTTPPEELVGYWVSTDQSNETCYVGGSYGWTTNFKGAYYRLTLNADGTYVMETDLQPDADNLISSGNYVLTGDSLLLDNDYDCRVSSLTATSMELDWTQRVEGCGIDNTYYEHFVFDKILPEK